MRKLLAFDYGASSGRAILGRFDGNTLSLEEIHRYLNEPVMVRGSFQWDILRLYHELKQGMIKAVKRGDGDISGMGIDTWGVDFGLLDAAGQLLGPVTHYRDKRTDGMMEAAFAKVTRREIYDNTGIQFMFFNSLYQMLALKYSNAVALERAETLLFVPDLLAYFLTGVKASEYTIASTSQMLNPVTGDWAKGMMDKLGLRTDILADIINPGTVIGKVTQDVTDETGMGAIPFIAVAEHDTGSAVLAVPVTEGNYAYLSSGTWSLMGVELEKPVINDTTYNLNFTNEGGFGRTTRLLKNIMGLWVYQECKRDWDKKGDAMSFDELEAEAALAKPFKCFIDPDNGVFAGPGNMPAKVRDFCKSTGQAVPETKGEIVRCVMESLAMKYRMAFRGLETISGGEIPVLHIVGGGTKNVILNQFTANAIGRPVITGPTEATAMGNLASQLIALGEVKNVSEARAVIRNSSETREYLPTDVDAWGEAYHRFEKIAVLG